jgi:hypothetical protein
MADLTKLLLYSETPGFKNNNVYVGSVSIPATPVIANGAVEHYAYVDLLQQPDIIDAMFQTSATVRGFDGAPNLTSGQWFKPGVHGIVQPGSGSSSELFYQISWLTLLEDGIYKVQIRFAAHKSSTGTFTPSSSITVNYRFIDYSAL